VVIPSFIHDWSSRREGACLPTIHGWSRPESGRRAKAGI
jgi:hypothetical protein